jgi:hypothetical protein
MRLVQHPTTDLDAVSPLALIELSCQHCSHLLQTLRPGLPLLGCILLASRGASDTDVGVAISATAPSLLPLHLHHNHPPPQTFHRYKHKHKHGTSTRAGAIL